jgi:5-carboxymethyl-2-hydroxymuconate isomerase
LPTQLENCKSCVVGHDDVHVADGAPQKGFVHVTLQILPGRSADILEKVYDGLAAILTPVLHQHANGADVQLTLNIMPLDPGYRRMIIAA